MSAQLAASVVQMGCIVMIVKAKAGLGTLKSWQCAAAAVQQRLGDLSSGGPCLGSVRLLKIFGL